MKTKIIFSIIFFLPLYCGFAQQVVDQNRVWGVTIDDISGLSAITTSLSSHCKKMTTRIVFDEWMPATYYSTAVNQISNVSFIMGELLDSYYVKDYTVNQYLDRTTEYLNAFQNKVDIWEIGNEINGEWLGNNADVVAKMKGSYDLVKSRGKKAAITLYYNHDCWARSSNEMFTWSKNNIPQYMKDGLDYVWVSYYEDDCNNYQPDWQQVFDKVHAMFPNAKIGLGECGTTVTSKKQSYINRYYSMNITTPNYVGGYFWWYYKQDCVPNTKSYWTDINNNLNCSSSCTVPSQPSVISGSTSVCAGTNVTYSVSNVSGVTYSWSYSGTGVTFSGTGSSVTATFASNASSGTITVRPSNSCGTGTGRALAITVSTLPSQPSIITGSTSVCRGAAINYSVTNVIGVTYTWSYTGSGVTFTGSGNSVTANFSSTATSGNINVRPSNSCGSGTTRSLAVTVSTTSAPAQPSAITGNSAVCAGSSGSYSVTNVSGVTYTWSYTGTGVTFTGSGSSVTATFASNATGGNITVTPATACGTGTPRTLAISVSSLPAQPSTITGSTTVCGGTSSSYSVSNVAGQTYTWSYTGTGVTFSGTGSSITANFSSSATNGNITVTPATSCGTGTPRILAITVTTPPTKPSAITGNNKVCAGSIQVYSVTNVAGITYSWTYSGSGVTFSGNSSSITATFANNATSGNIFVTPSNVCGTGISSARTISVVPIGISPCTAPLVASIAGPSVVEPGEKNVEYIVDSDTSCSYQWTVPANVSIIEGQGTNRILVDFKNTGGNISLEATNAFGITTVNKNVTVNTVTGTINFSGLNVNIYPNPSDNFGVLEINSVTNDNITVRIFKPDSKNLIEELFAGTAGPLTIGERLQPGCYIIEIIAGEKTSRVKWIKQ
ncbi:MAG: T9SS type A sorting domain-containing protein [Cytophagaceae bacterium]